MHKHSYTLQWILTKEVGANTLDLLALLVLVYKSLDTQGHLWQRIKK